MDQTLEAIYEGGLLRPTTPLTGIVDGQRVWVTVQEPAPEGADTACGDNMLLRQLEEEGLVVPAPSPAPPAPVGFRPLNLPGEALSQDVIRERR
jgi:hypothetical protein